MHVNYDFKTGDTVSDHSLHSILQLTVSLAMHNVMILYIDAFMSSYNE